MNAYARPAPELLSIVVPCHNEGDVLATFHSRLAAALACLSPQVEILYINDGSHDDTRDRLAALRDADSRVGVIDLSRNFGKEAALTAGLDKARGDAVVVLDADLQDPPELIPRMLAAWRQGFDVVAMKRADRSKDTAFKRLTARWYYRLLSRVSDVDIPQDVGDFRLLGRPVVEALKRLPERNRYMKGLFAWVGFRTIELPYPRDARAAGDTKLPFLRLLGLALDGITSFSILPLRFASAAGSLIAIGALIYGAVILLRTLLYGNPVAGFPTLIVVMTFLGGAQLLAIGVLGEYVGRLLVESKQRPLYLVESFEIPRQDADVVSLTRRSATGQ